MAEAKEYNLTRSGISCLKSRLEAQGIKAPDGDRGVVEHMGVKLDLSYAEASQTLRVEIAEKPAFVPESLVWSFVDTAVQSCAEK